MNLVKFCVDMGITPADSEELRIKKSSLVLVPLIVGLAAFIWGLIFIGLNLYLSASIPLSYAFISVLNLWHYKHTKNIDFLQKSQMILVLFLPFFLMWSLGGFALGSYVMIWAFFTPIAALTYESKNNSLKWFIAFLALVAFSTAIDQILIANHRNTMPQIAIELFFLLNISAGLSGIFFLIRNFIQAKASNAHKRLEKEHHALLLKEKDLMESELRFRQLAENINEVFWLGSPDWMQVYYISPSIKELWGIDPEDLYREPRLWMGAIHPEDREQVIANIPSDPETIGDFVDFEEYRIQRANNTIVWIKARAYPIRNPEGEVIRIAGIAEDVTARKLADDKILHQAHFDNLTNLPNRFLSLDRLSQLLIEAQRNRGLVAVLFLDLDEFKKVNDNLGHEAGDKILIESANRLNRVVRSGDTVGRLGGDEFIVLLGNLTDAADARPIAENIINRFRDAFKIDNRELLMTVSIGISIFPTDGNEASELLRRADSAMYHSKGIGRNTYSYFTDEMNQDTSRRLALEEQMHGALARDEFEVFYQPKLDLKNNKIMGAEALLRWNNPALGHISPKEFIPIAEQTGLIIPIGEHILNEALKATKQWHINYDPDFRIAVNLSPRQFREFELVPHIEQTLNKLNIASECLEMEITEGILLSGHGYINDTITALSNLGVGIAMDDFGTGYSSLSYLRKYPFTVIKVDRSFISDLNIDEADQKLVNASIAMAHGLKLKVVAEGIETEEQLATLKEMNCDLGQGYLLGKPMPEEDFTKILEEAER
jgi:diguanylate cyclase (GGDEF)-like protein/PAS domain S-box-containing protein